MSVLWLRYNAVATTRRSCGLFKQVQWAQTQTRTRSSAAQEATSRPRLLQPSVWDSIFPRSLREAISARARGRGRGRDGQQQQSNPATFFIWIFLFIGSQSVRILSLKNEHKAYMRRADLKLAQLREVVEKLHRGEDVDVEQALGTGDESQELEWEEAMRELATEELQWQQNREKAREEQLRQQQEQEDADPVNDGSKVAAAAAAAAAAAEAEQVSAPPPPPTAPPQAPGFY